MKTEGINTEEMLEAIISHGLTKIRSKYGKNLNDNLISHFLMSEIRLYLNVGIKRPKLPEIKTLIEKLKSSQEM